MKNQLFVNADNDLFWWMYVSVNGKIENFEEKIRKYVRGYANNGITDMLYCCFMQQSMFPTKVLDWYGDKYYQLIENGIDVDYTNEPRIKHVVEMYERMDKDPFDVLIDETRKCGMKGWLSIRMNDHHYQKEQTAWIHGSMYYEGKEKGWFIGEDTGKELFTECYDFSVDEFRERMYNYVCEVLDRYDMDGLELDFMREIYCFNYLKDPECYKIMTEFMQKVRAYLRKKEEERGHKINLLIRLNRDPVESKLYGFDAEEYIKQDLVDIIVPTSRWFSTDTDMPIDKWKELAKGTNVQIVAGLESFLFHPVLVKEETAKGLTAQYMDAGSDGMYLYNFFRTCVQDESEAEDVCLFMYSGAMEYPTTALSAKEEGELRKTWRACSSLAEAKKGVRRHVMSYQESHATPVGVEGYRPLPAEINGEKCFTLQTGECSNDACSLIIGLKRGSDLPEVTVDGIKAKSVRNTDDAYVCDRNNSIFNSEALVGTFYLKYDISVSQGNVRSIALKADQATLTYLEIKVVSNE